jgi:hypothetical protein
MTDLEQIEKKVDVIIARDRKYDKLNDLEYELNKVRNQYANYIIVYVMIALILGCCFGAYLGYTQAQHDMIQHLTNLRLGIVI